MYFVSFRIPADRSVLERIVRGSSPEANKCTAEPLLSSAAVAVGGFQVCTSVQEGRGMPNSGRFVTRKSARCTAVAAAATKTAVKCPSGAFVTRTRGWDVQRDWVHSMKTKQVQVRMRVLSIICLYLVGSTRAAQREGKGCLAFGACHKHELNMDHPQVRGLSFLLNAEHRSCVCMCTSRKWHSCHFSLRFVSAARDGLRTRWLSKTEDKPL